MNTYEVMIQAKVTKSFLVGASTQEEAEDIAHHMFTLDDDSHNRGYEQDTVGKTQLIK